MVSSDTKNVIKEMESRGLEVANGCTEPAAIAYTAALAASYLYGAPEKLEVRLSSNIMKNAQGVGIPNSQYRGVDFAAALGALKGNPNNKLQVFSSISSEAQEEVTEFVKAGNVEVAKQSGVDNLYVDVVASNKWGWTRAVVVHDHTNLTKLEKNGEILFQKPFTQGSEKRGATLSDKIGVKDIVDYVVSEDFDDKMFVKAIESNMAVSKDGLENNRGFNVSVYDLGDSYVSKMVKATAAAVVSRMSGVDKEVVANSGSGNQGLTTTVPVVTYAQEIGATEKETIKAVAVSNYVAMYIKQNLNVLSHLCGAVTASAGTAAGITFLKGGNAEQIEAAAVNVLSSLTGMFCDGAKETCALKVASGVHAAVFGSECVMNNEYVNNVGIVKEDLLSTVKNIKVLEQSTADNTNAAVFRAVFENILTK